MKRIISLILVLAVLTATILLVACTKVSDNKINIKMLNTTYFPKVHIFGNYNDCLTIKSWYRSSDIGVIVETEEYGELYLSNGTFVLIKDECPFCHKNH